MTSTTKVYVVCLPTYGRPYIYAEIKDKNDHDKTIRKCVQGDYETMDPKAFRLIPLFCENPKWELARRLLTSKSVVVYVNEDGKRACVPNMATLNLWERIPVFGEIAVCVPAKVMSVLVPDLSVLAEEEEEE